MTSDANHVREQQCRNRDHGRNDGTEAGTPMRSSTVVVQQDGGEKRCGRCGMDIDMDDGFVERRDGKDTLCVDCLFVVINDGTLALVDPKKKLGLHCHKCNVKFTMTDGMVQRGTTGALYCFKCEFAPPKSRRRAK